MSDSKMVSFNKLCYGAQFKYSAEEAAVWVKIGHNTVAGWKPEYVSDSWIGQPICAFAEDDQLDTDVFLVTPTPAEDVRAVGEEPVGYAMQSGLERISRSEHASHAIYASDNQPGWDVPLYRHPQRPVVLPERKPEPYKVSVGLIPYHEGWNACIDEFERLNR